VSKIWSVVLVQTKGLGLMFHSLIHVRMSASSSVMLWGSVVRRGMMGWAE
jgi:hypothetical protein